ncbi:MAG: transcriptional regulator GcvA [Pseudomonadota bacterium]
MRYLRQLNLNALIVIESAARLGSFARAAEESLITPSAVSQRVSTAEKQLGFSVFERRQNSVTLTQEGEEYIAHIREALDTIMAAGLQVNDRVRDSVLKISVLPTFAVRWLMPRIAKFDEAYPDVRLHIAQSYRPVDFNREDMDLAIRYGDGNFGGLHATLLMQEDLVPALSPQLLQKVMPESRAQELVPADLKKFTLLHSATCHLNWRSWFRHAGVPDAIETARAMSFDSCMLSFQAANMGIGVAVANRAYIADDIKEGRLIAPLSIKHPKRNGWYVVFPKGHAGMLKVKVFRDWLLDEAEDAITDMQRLFFCGHGLNS